MCEVLESSVMRTQQGLRSNIDRLLKDYTLATKEIHGIVQQLDTIFRVFTKMEHFHKKEKREHEDEDEEEESGLLDSTQVKWQNSGL